MVILVVAFVDSGCSIRFGLEFFFCIPCIIRYTSETNIYKKKIEEEKPHFSDFFLKFLFGSYFMYSLH